jgi:hypothetical protein
MAAARVGRCDRTLELVGDLVETPERIGPDLNIDVATCLEKQGRNELALRHFEQAARISPPGPLRDEAQRGVHRVGLTLQDRR